VLSVHRGEETRQIPARADGDLLSALREGGLRDVPSVCGGKGTCGKCVVKVGPRADAARYALACRQGVGGLAPGDEIWLDEVPDLEIQTEFAGPATALGGEPGGGVAVAVDVGTTTVAVALVDLESGRTLALASDRNAQAAFGADVLSRIVAASESGTAALAGPLREQIADLTRHALEAAGVGAGRLKGYAVAGNTVMEHFVAGLSPESIGQAPFEPLSRFGSTATAGALGLPGREEAPVYLVPAVAGYVGGDITAGVLACQMEEAAGRGLTTCLVDLGTNGEIAVMGPEGLTACATAAGPAFEGAQIECGTPAVAGAVDRVRAGAGQLVVSTILRAKPIGICGSGLVDALAAALSLGLVDASGQLLNRQEVAPHLHKYLTAAGQPARLLLTGDGTVYLTQADVHQLQLAKGAVAAGVDVVLRELGLEASQISRVWLAGGFGARVNPRSLARIGMIPEEFAQVAAGVGNSALAGAVEACFPSRGTRERLESLARSCRYLELSVDARFTGAFMERITFPVPEHQGYEGVDALACGLGFERVAPLDPSKLAPKAEVREMCAAAGACQAYGKNWMCPPACPDTAALAARAATYREGILVQTVRRLADRFDWDGMMEAQRAHKRRFRRLVGSLQAAYPRQMPLGAGTCDLCPECTYPDAPCRLPGLAHPSMEAAGLLVAEVCQAAGIPYHHGAETIAYTSCVLLT
jgi:uncharacterized 2Fe-2S/4Fe-4S cluster protein (DUF4445 family)/predicted metal-binding protein